MPKHNHQAYLESRKHIPQKTRKRQTQKGQNSKPTPRTGVPRTSCHTLISTPLIRLRPNNLRNRRQLRAHHPLRNRPRPLPPIIPHTRRTRTPRSPRPHPQIPLIPLHSAQTDTPPPRIPTTPHTNPTPTTYLTRQRIIPPRRRDMKRD